jgi:hypothetical protein
MKKVRFTEEHMLRILREADQVPAAEFATHDCRLDSHRRDPDIK